LHAGEFGVVYKAHLISSKPGIKRKISRQSILSESTMPDIVAVKTLKGKRKISRQSILSESTMPDIIAVKTLKG